MIHDIFQTQSSEDDELDDLRNDLNTHINEDSVVLVIQLDNQCDIQPGMLAEEKVYLFFIQNFKVVRINSC